MNQKTIEAIEGSVRKHDCIAQGLKEDGGITDCPLCQMFKPKEHHCIECPVTKAVNTQGCENTPYDYYGMMSFGEIRHLYEYKNLQAAIDADCNFCDAVEAEIEFLISLLPEDHKWRQECL